MYHLINNHIQLIVGSIQNNHVSEYDWLVQNIQEVEDPHYQNRYKNYWRLNAARLSPNYCQTYFLRLKAGLQGNPLQLYSLANQLYQTPTHRNGRQSLQFSFCTKLCHMLNRQIPIYDAMIRGFYFFSEPKRKLQIHERIDGYIEFHQFLINEYNRVINEGIFANSIRAFRHHFKPNHFTDVKIIDSLIWAFISLLRNGELMQGNMVYC